MDCASAHIKELVDNKVRQHFSFHLTLVLDPRFRQNFEQYQQNLRFQERFGIFLGFPFTTSFSGCFVPSGLHFYSAVGLSNCNPAEQHHSRLHRGHPHSYSTRETQKRISSHFLVSSFFKRKNPLSRVWFGMCSLVDSTCEASLPAYHLHKLSFAISLFLKPFCLIERIHFAISTLGEVSQRRKFLLNP